MERYLTIRRYREQRRFEDGGVMPLPCTLCLYQLCPMGLIQECSQCEHYAVKQDIKQVFTDKYRGVIHTPTEWEPF
jgi:hypothetical protein